jgi:hypothetical protein
VSAGRLGGDPLTVRMRSMHPVGGESLAALPATTPVARAATRGSSIRPTRRPSKRSSRSCARRARRLTDAGYAAWSSCSGAPERSLGSSTSATWIAVAARCLWRCACPSPPCLRSRRTAMTARAVHAPSARAGQAIWVQRLAGDRAGLTARARRRFVAAVNWASARALAFVRCSRPSGDVSAGAIDPLRRTRCGRSPATWRSSLRCESLTRRRRGARWRQRDRGRGMCRLR